MTLEAADTSAADIFAEFWREIDEPAHWPATTDTACALLRAAGFDVSSDLLSTWARSGQVGGVAIERGQFAWTPASVQLAAALCNASRRWIPLHPRQLHKLSAIELAQQQAEALGTTVFSDAGTVDFRSLVGVLQNTDDAQLRGVLCVALLSKLKAAGLE